MLPKDRSSRLFNETPGLDRGPSRDMRNAAHLVAMAYAIECTAAADDGKLRTPTDHGTVRSVTEIAPTDIRYSSGRAAKHLLI